MDMITAVGLDPKTGLPINGISSAKLKENIKKQLRVFDEQDAVNRYKWNNLPIGIDGKRIIERILYYKGQGMFYFDEVAEKYYFLPYALNGSIDVYGRYMQVSPVPLGSTYTEKDNEALSVWLSQIKRKPYYSMEEVTNPDPKVNCVLLTDYTNQRSQTVLSRQILNDPILDVMADCIPYMRTALQNSTGV